MSLSMWLDKDAEPDFTRIAKHGIKIVFIDPRSANAARVTSELRVRDILPGIYYALSWDANGTPEQNAQSVSDFVQKDGIVEVGEPVMLDIEAVPLAYASTFIQQVRAHLPRRPVSVTFEPGQDSSIVPVHLLVAYGYDFYVQLYHGDMSPAPAYEVMPALMDLVAKGLPYVSVLPFYDAAHIPWDATDGCVFTQGRLPA